MRQRGSQPSEKEQPEVSVQETTWSWGSISKLSEELPGPPLHPPDQIPNYPSPVLSCPALPCLALPAPHPAPSPLFDSDWDNYCPFLATPYTILKV